MKERVESRQAAELEANKVGSIIFYVCKSLSFLGLLFSGGRGSSHTLVNPHHESLKILTGKTRRTLNLYGGTQGENSP